MAALAYIPDAGDLIWTDFIRRWAGTGGPVTGTVPHRRRSPSTSDLPSSSNDLARPGVVDELLLAAGLPVAAET